MEIRIAKSLLMLPTRVPDDLHGVAEFVRILSQLESVENSDEFCYDI